MSDREEYLRQRNAPENHSTSAVASDVGPLDDQVSELEETGARKSNTESLNAATDAGFSGTSSTNTSNVDATNLSRCTKIYKRRGTNVTTSSGLAHAYQNGKLLFMDNTDSLLDHGHVTRLLGSRNFSPNKLIIEMKAGDFDKLKASISSFTVGM